MLIEELTRTRAIAGPNPFHSAPKPSAAIVFRKQSTKPVYVPVGADCNLDLRTCKCQRVRSRGKARLFMVPTSGGMAIAHIETPAVPPANMTTPRFRSADVDPAGVKNFFVNSYDAKYLGECLSVSKSENLEIKN